ncbi:DUF488 domain-containing protein [Candidatus Parcubacteria bacterium]|nr:DUF488 domain-containing protein [Candidatus Parcubacteria bacterium]
MKNKDHIAFTLGTSNRTLEEFFEILKLNKIESVVDVRRWPSSKLFPHFEKQNLKNFLEKQGINYYHLEKLGGFRENGYQNYTKTKEFQEGLKELIKILSKSKTAIICAEKLPWKCHRAFIAQKLNEKKIKVFHIINKEKIWNPQATPHQIKPSCERK